MIDVSIEVAATYWRPDEPSQKVLNGVQPTAWTVVDVLPIVEFPTLSKYSMFKLKFIAQFIKLPEQERVGLPSGFL